MYQKLQELLREAIESGEFAEGEQFLTERQVVDRYRVSRPTANKVLSGMAAEGLLEFRKGVGTFVRRVPWITMGGRWSASRKKLSMQGATHPLRCWISTGSRSRKWRRRSPPTSAPSPAKHCWPWVASVWPTGFP